MKTVNKKMQKIGYSYCSRPLDIIGEQAPVLGEHIVNHLMHWIRINKDLKDS